MRGMPQFRYETPIGHSIFSLLGFDSVALGPGMSGWARRVGPPVLGQRYQGYGHGTVLVKLWGWVKNAGLAKHRGVKYGFYIRAKFDVSLYDADRVGPVVV